MPTVSDIKDSKERLFIMTFTTRCKFSGKSAYSGHNRTFAQLVSEQQSFLFEIIIYLFYFIFYFRQSVNCIIPRRITRRPINQFLHDISTAFRAQELCESRGGRPELPVSDSRHGLCGRKATLEEEAEQHCSLPSSEECRFQVINSSREFAHFRIRRDRLDLTARLGTPHRRDLSRTFAQLVSENVTSLRTKLSVWYFRTGHDQLRNSCCRSRVGDVNY